MNHKDYYYKMNGTGKNDTNKKSANQQYNFQGNINNPNQHSSQQLGQQDRVNTPNQHSSQQLGQQGNFNNQNPKTNTENKGQINQKKIQKKDENITMSDNANVQTNYDLPNNSNNPGYNELSIFNQDNFQSDKNYNLDNNNHKSTKLNEIYLNTCSNPFRNNDNNHEQNPKQIISPNNDANDKYIKQSGFIHDINDIQSNIAPITRNEIKSSLGKKCVQTLNGFNQLKIKEKRLFADDFTDLLEQNIDEAEEIYIGFAELFETHSELIGSKEEYEEMCKQKQRNNIQVKLQFILPPKIKKLESVLMNYGELEEKEQKYYEEIYNEICKIDPKSAYNLFDAQESSFEKNPRLKAIKDQYWNDLKKHIKTFNVKNDCKLVGKVRNISIYHKQSDNIAPDEEKEVKNLLIVGETGSGKSTLLNAMATYLMGIRFFDPVRIKMIVENTEVSQTESQTKNVTAYTIIPDSKIFEYPVRFIDTPGFGDTRGLDQDKKNAAKIWNFIKNNCNQLHAICFVIKGSTNRLTVIQEYIVIQILQLFGKDVVDNFLGMITFADSKEPQALEAIRNSDIPVNKTFKFNNSAVFPTLKNDCEDSMAQQYWDMGIKNFDIFFNHLRDIDPVPLVMTKQVISAREAIILKITTLKEKITQAINTRHILEENMEIFNRNLEKINKNKDFKYNTMIQKKIKKGLSPGKLATICKVCKFTCHNKCTLPQKKNRNKCYAIKNNLCTVCPNKCHWDKHEFLQTYYYDTILEQKEETWYEKQKEYLDGKNQIQRGDVIMSNLKEQILEVTKGIIDDINSWKTNMELLDRIALQPVKEEITEYMEIMIKQEKNERNPGYRERIHQIEKIKNIYKQFPKLQNPEEIFKSKDFENMIIDYKDKTKKLYAMDYNLSSQDSKYQNNSYANPDKNQKESSNWSNCCVF